MPPAPGPQPLSTTRTRRAATATRLGAVLAAALLAGCTATGGDAWPTLAAPSGTASATGAAASVGTSGPPAPRGGALAALEALPVKGRAPRTGYERSEFGPAWADVDRNGCDTRNDVLRRDLTAVVTRPGSRGCVVVRGSLRDPYTGRTVAFVRGQDTSDDVQIDHVVAMSDAWQKGAQRLTPALRRQLANDPLNLLAVDGPTNSAKSDSDAASWLPPSKAYRCAYVARQVSVKAAYGLWVTPAERSAARAVLARCPRSPLPARTPFPKPTAAPGASPR